MMESLLALGYFIICQAIRSLPIVHIIRNVITAMVHRPVPYDSSMPKFHALRIQAEHDELASSHIEFGERHKANIVLSRKLLNDTSW
ncbi:hypothetical protein F4678DRAFT_405153 [Xylaria arbuscula]|nr:hypothetical protein F4678DRAFT_405153 [Xylaria arbuscula]